jgi:hypothetical protein
VEGQDQWMMELATKTMMAESRIGTPSHGIGTMLHLLPASYPARASSGGF